ncbi:MAG TPA: alpha/beta hydrolase [Acidimicrobiales bacterium]
MSLHPRARTAIEIMVARGFRPVHRLTVAEARRQMTALTRRQTPGPAVAAVTDRHAPGPAGDVPVRVYDPDPTRSSPPALVYLHGGGGVLGDLDSHDPICRWLAHLSGCVVVAVAYRLAPEHPHPAGLDDADAVTRWARGGAGDRGVDPHRVAVGGDSAGGNLAAAVALRARDRGEPLAFQLLLYPALDREPVADAGDDAAEIVLGPADVPWFWSRWIDGVDGAAEEAFPLRAASLAGAPPALVVTAEHDPLRDQGDAYAHRLADAGVPAVAVRYAGMPHGFASMAPFLEAATAALEHAGATLRRALEPGAGPWGRDLTVTGAAPGAWQIRGEDA